MTSERDDDVEDVKLRALPRETALPPELEERVVAALRERRLIRTRHRASRLWLAAAAAICFGAGWFGRGLAGPRTAAPDDGPLYVLLLSPLAGSPDLPPEAELVREEQAWATTLRRNHQLVRAERLASDAELVGPSVGVASTARTIPGAPPSGFFLVRANTMREAVDMAHACPHVRHGGTVTVHAVDTP
jgi:hypothetical protein